MNFSSVGWVRDVNRVTHDKPHKHKLTHTWHGGNHFPRKGPVCKMLALTVSGRCLPQKLFGKCITCSIVNRV